MTPSLIVMPDEEGLARRAAEAIAQAAGESIAASGRFMLALPGGRTPLPTYRLLASARIDWTRVHVFWGDERCVPPDHPESNFGGASATLLDGTLIPRSQIYRMRGEDPDPDSAAADYAGTLGATFGINDGRPPRFDLILLGLGTDGHTASLFPGSPALTEVSKSVAAVYVEKLRSYRLTLTLPVLNAAARILFLAAGAEKAPALRKILQEGPSDGCPASLVRPVNGQVTWIVDQAAGGLIAGKE